eukprot:m.204166 g.204166  ORF g.204166 m.204166 type:complete len:721 (-) comp17743_c0_seq3:4374-6536(-)
MKVVALVSGGKDSCHNMLHCVALGHEIVALANLHPPAGHGDEMDSFMYQTVGHEAIELIAQAMQLPLFRRAVSGTAVSQGKAYAATPGDEVEDLLELLQAVRAAHPDVGGVAVGAILSDYQRLRVESVCARMGLTVLAYLWQRNQAELLDEMLACNLSAVLIKVAALGLEPKRHLGKTLREVRGVMHKLEQMYGVHICGEGGEYESLTLDSPLFWYGRIVIDETRIVAHADNDVAPVGYLQILKAHLEAKEAVDKQSDLKAQARQLLTAANPARYVFEESSTSPSAVAAVLAPRVSSTPCEYSKTTPSAAACLVTVPNGRLAYLGSVAAASPGQEAVEAQTRQTLEQAMQALEAAGLSPADVVSVSLLVADMANFPAINKVYGEFFKMNPPSRCCIGALLPVGVHLQLSCIAAKREDEIVRMHVQGISYWAPANIGPYSQAVKAGPRLHLAGMIGLVPETMVLAASFLEQARTALRSVQSVARSMSCSLARSLCCICYLTNLDNATVAAKEWSDFAREQGLDEADGDESGARDRLMVMVEVPTLPKAAQIEWQFILHPVIAQHRGDCTSVSTRDVVIDGMEARLTLSLTACTGGYVYIQPRDSKASAIELLQSLAKCATEQLQSKWAELQEQRRMRAQDNDNDDDDDSDGHAPPASLACRVTAARAFVAFHSSNSEFSVSSLAACFTDDRPPAVEVVPCVRLADQAAAAWLLTCDAAVLL